MRETNRLYKFYDEVRRIHMQYVPDWRFGQLICNVFGTIGTFFYMEEDDALQRLREYFGEISS
jgi:hypothetical protein